MVSLWSSTPDHMTSVFLFKKRAPIQQIVYFAMPSEEEQQSGPSGVSREELSPLLGLNVPNDDEEEAVEEEEEDLSCNQAMDDFDRQRTFQTQLLEQSGGGIDPETPVGTFEFDLQPYVNRTSARMGVHEHHFTTRLRQTGNFVDTPHVAQTLRDGLQRAMPGVLNNIPDLHDHDRLYFNISSNRLSRGDFNGWGVRVGERREGGDGVDAVLNRLSRALNSNEQFEVDDYFQLSITQVRHAPQGSGRKHQLKSKKRSVCSHCFKPYNHARKHRCKSEKTVLISPEQLKREQREILNTRKKAIYEDVLNIVQNMHDWLFKNKQALALVLQALRRRDLRGIAQGVQASQEFYDLCRKSGSFSLEPPLWDMVYGEIKQDDCDIV